MTELWGNGGQITPVRRCLTRVADMPPIEDATAQRNMRLSAAQGSAALFDACEALIERMARAHGVSGAFVRSWLDARV